MSHRTGVIILSGGRSERMRSPKAFLKFGEFTFLEKLIDTYKNIVQEVVVVMNEELMSNDGKKITDNIKKDCTLVINRNPEKGKLYSLKLGAQQITCDHCFIQPIDNPFIDDGVLNTLLIEKNPTGSTIPKFKDHGGHPILVSAEVLSRIRSIQDMNMHLKDLLKEFDKKYVSVNEGTILVNINTPEEYLKHLQLN